jgi:hypothetical protein
MPSARSLGCPDLRGFSLAGNPLFAVNSYWLRRREGGRKAWRIRDKIIGGSRSTFREAGWRGMGTARGADSAQPRRMPGSNSKRLLPVFRRCSPSTLGMHHSLYARASDGSPSAVDGRSFSLLDSLRTRLTAGGRPRYRHQAPRRRHPARANDEWAVQRARYMTLETIAPISDNPIVGLPAVAT